MRALIPVIALLALSVTGCQSESETTTTSSAPGLKAYIDPVTGELTTPPPAAVQQQNLQYNTMDVKQEEPVTLIPLENGGYRIPLNGRFMHELSATVQEDGSLKIEENIKE
jgi:hypothetical protein